MARYKLNPADPPALTQAEQARLESLTPSDCKAAALADPENLRLTEAELARIRSAQAFRRVRARTGLSQAAFAAAYHINPARLRDLEQARTAADSALLAYLAVIEREPDLVRHTLHAAHPAA
jgi:putative transcriptional regulator